MSKPLEKAHAELSASGSERWLNCCGSVPLIREAPVPPDSKWAAEGTLAHHYLEMWLEAIKYNEPRKELKKLERDNLEMYLAVKRAVDFIKKEWDETKQTLLIEERISLEHIGPDMFGTADIGIVEVGNHLQVWDYKHGAGKAVDVAEVTDFSTLLNSQLAYYGLGLAHRYKYKFKKVTLGVLQPRASHVDGWKRSITVPMSELRQYEYIFRKGVERVQQGRTTLFVGPWCHWCPAKNFNCPKHEALKYEKAHNMFGDDL